MSDLGPEARAILDAGRDGDDPTPADRARVRRNLAQAIAAGSVIGAAKGASAAAVAKGTAAAGAAASTATASSLGVGAKALIGVVLALGALGGGYAMGRAELAEQEEKAGRPAASAAVTAPASTPPGEREARGDNESPKAPSPDEAAPSAASLPPSSADKGSDRASPRPTAKASGTSTGAPMGAPMGATVGAPPPADVDTLADETRRLREAHGALQSGDAAKALEMLEQQSAAYDRGELREERAAARVLTLCKLGRVAEAKAAAAAFLRASPRSPLADRVRAGCSSPND